MNVRQMTTAQVREPTGADHVEVMFYESARIYRLPRDRPSFEADLRLLREAAAAGTPLTVAFASLESEVIESLERVEP